MGLAHGKNNIPEIRAIIDHEGGRREYLINWEWAYFEDEGTGRRVFNHVKEYCEHRGFHPADPDSPNENLRLAAFRFR